MGTGEFRPRKRCDGGLFPITLEQFVVFAVVQRAARAGRDAGRGQALLKIVPAEVAFGHLLALGVKLRRAVGTVPFAVAAPHTTVRIHGDDAVLVFVHGLRGAGFGTDGVLAVVARQRHVVGEDVLFIGVAHGKPFTAGIFQNPPPQHAFVQVMLVDAGDHAGLAAGAQFRIEVECRIFDHESVLFFGLRYGRPEKRPSLRSGYAFSTCTRLVW